MVIIKKFSMFQLECFFTFDMFGPIEFNLLSNKHQHDLTSSYDANKYIL